MSLRLRLFHRLGTARIVKIDEKWMNKSELVRDLRQQILRRAQPRLHLRDVVRLKFCC